MSPVFQFIQELLTDIGNQSKIPLRIALHEFTNHRLIVILRHESTDYQVIRLRRKPLFSVPVKQTWIIVRQLTLPRLSAVRDVGGLWMIFTILIVNILLNVLAIAYQQITMFGHQTFRCLPVSADRCAPLRPHPLVPIWIDIKLATKLVNSPLEMGSKRSNSACKNIYNRMKNVVFLDICNTVIQRGNIIVNSLSRTNIRYINVKTIRIVI